MASSLRRYTRQLPMVLLVDQLFSHQGDAFDLVSPSFRCLLRKSRDSS